MVHTHANHTCADAFAGLSLISRARSTHIYIYIYIYMLYILCTYACIHAGALRFSPNATTQAILDAEQSFLAFAGIALTGVAVNWNNLPVQLPYYPPKFRRVCAGFLEG